MDWQTWQVNFANPVNNAPVILVTGTDQFSSLETNPHLSAITGTVRDADENGFLIANHSTDCAGGECAANYVGLCLTQANDDFDPRSLYITTGIVSDPSAGEFFPQCTEGDTDQFPVPFPAPFLTPPLVLITAAGDPSNDPGGEAATPAVVGLATYVTTDYFMLTARNSDEAAGYARFNYFAIGVGPGYGQGPLTATE